MIRPAHLAQRLLDSLTGAPWVTFSVVFYNLDNNRNEGQVSAEIRALADPLKGKRPLIIGVSEAIHYGELPDLPGYRMIRDRSTSSRDNIAAYVRDDVKVGRVKWHDMETEWQRPNGPGMHPARSFVEFFVGEVQVVVAHMAQLSAVGGKAAQAEQSAALVRILAPWTSAPLWARLFTDERKVAKARARIILWDRNRATIAGLIKGQAVGDLIDRAEVRNIKALSHVYKTTAAGVPLLSNHGHAYKAQLSVARPWLWPPA